MSHILNALERAAADRERHSLPGLRLAPMPAAQADDEDDRPAGPPALLIAAVVLVSAALAAWLLANWRPAPPAPAPPTPVVQIAPTGAAPAAASASRRAQRPVAVPAEAPTPALSTAASSAEPAAPGPLTRAVARSQEAAAPSASTSPTRATPAPRSRRVHALEELPPELRRELPQLAISLWMHSDVPAHRMLVINGESYKEGSRIGPDLFLEQIGNRAAVFRYKGWRYRVSA